MVRPREFDRDAALERATGIFWAKGFASTSTEDLLAAMNIGRQSMYNAFGDKRSLYMEVLQTYHQKMVSVHLKRLNGEASPLEGIRALLRGLAPSDDEQRALGCLGVGAVGEFGTSDPELLRLAHAVSQAVGKRIAERIVEGQAAGVIDSDVQPATAAAFVLTTMTGLQLAARAGATMVDLHRQADFVVGRLKAA
ncbi:TetR/AcrR family transcriptional regulator [Cupriavidus pauculus]|uniref:TetR/AcrR family transcriptional regulator n=1 Tax=Cupriavidus pauculus TaxID=82633 RepID=A0A2N5C5L3_9BURK|nr:TetR/AcrR family transcriptional regulator [Cupriavidus pauculus]PLP97498.1 TetR/AcrR family transcriptional regulator [Cupriavidus pauculus]